MAIAAIKKVTSAGVTLATSTDNQVATVTGTDALTGESNLTFDGSTLNVVGNAGVGIARTDGTLHVHTGSAGTVTANVDSDDLVVENSGNAGVHVLMPDANEGRYSFGSPSSGIFGFMGAKYNSGSPYIYHYLNNSERMRIASNGNLQIGEAGGSGWGNYARLASVETANAGQINVRGALENASATGTVLYANCSRAASSSYRFLACYSSGSSDLEFNLRGDGNAYADGAWNGSGADYQEYFESQSGVAAEVGRTVVLDGDKIRYYNAATDSADDIIGVTRPEADNKNSAVVGNIAWNHWTDKYLTDDYGVYEREDIVVWEWPELLYAEGDTDIPANKNIGDIRRPYACVYERDELCKDPNWTPPADAVKTFDSVRKLNPAFDPAQEENYQSREERDEWWLIGLLGQIQIKAGEPTNPRWIKMKDISANVELWYVR